MHNTEHIFQVTDAAIGVFKFLLNLVSYTKDIGYLFLQRQLYNIKLPYQMYRAVDKITP